MGKNAFTTRILESIIGTNTSVVYVQSIAKSKTALLSKEYAYIIFYGNLIKSRYNRSTILLSPESNGNFNLNCHTNLVSFHSITNY